MAFTIGKYGIVTLLSLGKLMAAFYATCLIFIFVVLGSIAERQQGHDAILADE